MKFARVSLAAITLVGCTRPLVDLKPGATEIGDWWEADRQILVSTWGKVNTHTSQQAWKEEYFSSLERTIRLIQEGKPVLLGVLGQPIVSSDSRTPYEGDKPYIMDLPTKGIGDSGNPLSDAYMLAERRVVAWYAARGIYPVNSTRRNRP